MIRKELVLMVGLPSSGKSHYVTSSLAGSYQVVSTKAILHGLRNEGLTIPDDKLNDLYPIVGGVVRSHMHNGYGVVVDERNLEIESIFIWKKMAFQYKYSVKAIIIDTPVDVCIERIMKQGATNKEAQVERMRKYSEQLDELRLMFSMKHQNILTDFRVISYEEENKDEIL